MKSNRFMTILLVLSLIVGGASLPTGVAANPDQSALRAEAQATLAAVTIDVDQANIAYSPVDNVGPKFNQVVQYQEEYVAGRQSFEDGDYRDALKHLREADELIRRQPDWNESE